MFSHNLLIIYRNFRKYKMSFLINLIGLSIGLACSLLIYLWVLDEMSVDTFHEKDANLYEVMENQKQSGTITTQKATPDPLAEALLEEIPEIEMAVTVVPSEWFGKIPLIIGENKIKEEGQFVSKDYFKMFSFELLHGDRNKVLSDKKSIVISESLAEKLFGQANDVIGESIMWELAGQKEEHVITGIFKDLPPNTTERFSFLIPYEAFKDLSKKIGRPMTWDNHGPYTYVLLKNATNPESVNSKIKYFINNKISGSNTTLFLKPYSENYLFGDYENGEENGGRIEYVSLFSMIAIFILIMACINFMNLSTAKATRRIKEIGIKKAMGASRKSLILQYLSESMVMTILSLFLGLLIAGMSLPEFNEITGKNLEITFSGSFILLILSITIFTGLVSGSYPALYLSAFDPATVLKGTLKRSSREIFARSGLVIFQFALSVLLIVAVVVVYKQITFIQTKNLGYNKDNVIYFSKEGRANESLETYLAELKNIPGVKNVTSIAQNFIGNESSTADVSWEGKSSENIINFSSISANYDLIETLGMSMKTGRSFSKNHGSESTKIIFNETAIKVMDLKDPIGVTISLWGEKYQIIGVVKDFHFESFHEEVKPLFIRFSPDETMTILAKIEAGKEQNTVGLIESFSKEYTGYPCEYHFMDDDFQIQYAAENRVSKLSQYFAGLAILISCLGLFGLASFTAERRKKEVGIRKTLGSSNTEIVLLLSKDFTIIVLASLVISLPVSYFLVVKWLGSFAYRINLEWWFFAGAGLIALLIAWATVGIQAYKAAKADPINSLRADG